MKIKLFALVLGLGLLLAAFGGANAKGNTWSEYRAADGKFAVNVPGTFQVTAQTALTPMGPVQTPLFAQKDGTTGYFVSYVDFPKGYIATTSTEAALDSGIRNLARMSGAYVIAKWDNSSAGADGKEFAAVISPKATQAGAIVQGRVIMAQSRLYQVWVVADADQLPEAQAARYLDSFRLLNGLAMR